MSAVWEIDAANLFAGDDDPNSSEYLTMLDVKLPMLQEKTKEHLPGGSIASISYSMRVIEAMEMTFKLKGFNPNVMDKFGLNGGARRKYTVLGNLRNLADEGTEIQLRAVVEGRLIQMSPSNMQRDSGIEHDYQVSEIVFYSQHLDGVEKIWINTLLGPAGFRISGVSRYQNMARNIGLA